MNSLLVKLGALLASLSMMLAPAHSSVVSQMKFGSNANIMSASSSIIGNAPCFYSYNNIDGSYTLTNCGTSNSWSGLWQSASPSSTATINIDSNRGDSYTANGSYNLPYKTLSSAITAATGSYQGYVFNIAPGTYVDGAPDTWPPVPFTVFGGQATYVPASGVTFPGSFDIYDLTIAGNVVESDNSLSYIHDMHDGVITGNFSLAGLGMMDNMVMPTATSTLTIQSGALTNVLGSALYGVVNSQGILNLNDDQISSSSSLPLITSTSGLVYVNGATLINLGTGGGINIQNGATSSPNSLSNLSIVVGASATTTLTAGTAATSLCDGAGFTTITGTFIAPTGSNWISCYDEDLSVLNGLTIGTSTVSNNLVWDAAPSSTVRIGVTSKWPGCIEMYDAAASGTVNYVYSSGTALVDTSSKPAFCQ